MLSLTALLCQAQQASVGGQILGTVKGDDGTALGGANVLLQRTLSPGASLRERTQWASTASSGGVFSFQFLPTGHYTLCAQMPSGSWLNPCEWGGSPAAVSVHVGSQPLNTSVILARGAELDIRVDDPSQLLTQNEGKTPGAHLLLGVRSDALVFHAAFVTTQDSAGRNYSVTIPFAKPANLVVASSFFRLADSNGVTLPGNGFTTFPVTVSSGQPSAIIHLIIIGHK